MKKSGFLFLTAALCIITLTAFVKLNYITQTGSIEQVTIGKQVWLAANLNVDKFRNGEIIPQAKTNEEWLKAGKEGKPAWCYYENDPGKEKKYGKLYNWHAVSDPRGLAPEGWHISSEEEWDELKTFLGGADVAGYKLKSKESWSENVPGKNDGCGDNSSKFNALAGGSRDVRGNFSGMTIWSYWWTTKKIGYEGARFRHLTHGHNDLGKGDKHRGEGYYVRCVKD